MSMSDTFSFNKICKKTKNFWFCSEGNMGVSEGFIYFSNCYTCGNIKKFKLKLDLDLSIEKY